MLRHHRKMKAAEVDANTAPNLEYALENYRSFILAGRALFTIVNEKTGGQYTFAIRQKRAAPTIYYISVYLGRQKQYFAHYHKGTGILSKAKKHFTSEYHHTPFEVMRWLLYKYSRNLPLPEGVKIYHWAACAACGRTLTDPESIKIGLGPYCRGKGKGS